MIPKTSKAWILNSRVARNFVWRREVQLKISGQNLSFCKLKAKTQFYLVHNSLSLGGPNAPLATLLILNDIEKSVGIAHLGPSSSLFAGIIV